MKKLILSVILAASTFSAVAQQVVEQTNEYVTREFVVKSQVQLIPNKSDPVVSNEVYRLKYTWLRSQKGIVMENSARQATCEVTKDVTVTSITGESARYTDAKWSLPDVTINEHEMADATKYLLTGLRAIKESTAKVEVIAAPIGVPVITPVVTPDVFPDK